MLVGILKGIAKEFYVAVVVPCNRSMVTNSSERFRSLQRGPFSMGYSPLLAGKCLLKGIKACCPCSLCKLGFGSKRVIGVESPGQEVEFGLYTTFG